MHPETTDSAPLRQNALTRFRAWWAALSEPRRRQLKGLMIFEAIVLAAFIKPLVSLISYTLGTELHSHVPLIPFVSGWLLSVHQDKLPSDYRRSPGWAAAFALAGLVLLGVFWYAAIVGPHFTRNDSFVPITLSLLCFVVSGAFFFLGRAWMKQALFPACFLLFMVPLPDQLVHLMEVGSQHASAEATYWFLHLTSLPWIRDSGNSMVFHFPGIALRVAEECSGIRSSWVLFITGLVAANLFLKSGWRRALFVSLVIPLGILRNGFRIVTLGWLCVNVSPDMIDHWIHHRGGPVFFALSLIPLFLILLLLRRGETRAERKPPPDKKAGMEALPETI